MLLLKIRYRLAFWKRSLLFALGFGSRLLRNRYGAQMVVFHGIVPSGALRYNSRFVTECYFEEFVAYAKKHFHLLSVKDFYEKKFVQGKLNIALTFDDGYLNNWHYVVPILKKYKIPASFYITSIHKQQDFLWTDFVDLISKHTATKQFRFEGHLFVKNREGEFISDRGTLKNTCKKLTHDQIMPLYKIFKTDWDELKEHVKDYWKLMDKEQIAEIAGDPLFSIGAHGVTHADLTSIDFDEAREEIEDSKRSLDQICKRPITEFAFPFGNYCGNLIRVCKESQFSKILLVDFNSDEDRKQESLMGRFVINPHISLEHQMACLLKGSYF